MESNKDKYIEKLSKKHPTLMNRDELEDWLDYIIYDKMKYHTVSDIQRDTFEHLLYYFRLLHFELHLISAKAEQDRFLLRSFFILLKETNPAMVDAVLKITEEMTEQRNKELLKDEEPEDIKRIMNKIEELKKLQQKYDGGEY